MTQQNFTVDYGLTLQQGNIEATTANNAAAINFVGNSSGDGGGYTTMQLVPDDTVSGADQYLIIDPTGGGHIHIRAGGPQDNSQAILYLGGENSYVNIGAGINPPVSITANSYMWTFGTDGMLALPGSLTGSGASPAPSISGFDSISAITFSATGNISGNYFVGNGSQLTDVNAVTVDITDTNGLTTIYYPTFVENRTTSQIARADVNFTYRTDTNTLTVGDIITPPVPFANLTSVAGSRAFVSDANLVATGNFGNQISGGGSNTVPVWSDGTNWYIG